MIIFFEDGSINNSLLIDGKEVFKIDAAFGVTINYNMLLAIDKEMDFDTRVYTNSIIALSNRWCWDEQSEVPQVYIRNADHKWEHITHFTNRQLKQGHNLEKMYRSGEFDVFNTCKI